MRKGFICLSMLLWVSIHLQAGIFELVQGVTTVSNNVTNSTSAVCDFLDLPQVPCIIVSILVGEGVVMSLVCSIGCCAAICFSPLVCLSLVPPCLSGGNAILTIARTERERHERRRQEQQEIIRFIERQDKLIYKRNRPVCENNRDYFFHNLKKQIVVLGLEKQQKYPDIKIFVGRKFSGNLEL